MESNYCKYCNCDKIVKAGKVRSSQRYKCKICIRYFTAEKSESENIMMNAVTLYLEGMPLRGIGRYLGVSHTTVLRWIRKMAKVLKPVTPLKSKYIEIDELYFYLKSKKKKRWLWLAICRDTKRILGFQTGGRGGKTLEKLHHKIEPVQCERYYTDDHAPYKNVLPKEKLRYFPGGTNTIEGINSAIRHYLSRFRRRSKCYSKSLSMVEASINLLMFKFNKNYEEKILLKAA